MDLKLAISNVSKSYNSEQVLDRCSFSFDKVGTYVLMGANGSGKSTLLRICCLIEEPDAGEVIFRENGSVLIKDIALKRRITLVLPKVGVFNTTVFGNVAYGMKIRGKGREEIMEKATNALSMVGLRNKEKKNARELSSGETQRLGIARAIAIDPDILFLDEPTASVDHRNLPIIENLILSLKERGNSIIVLTTHESAQAERLADEILFLRDGKIG